MTESLPSAVKRICKGVENDPTRLMDIAREVQGRFRCVSNEAIDLIANQLEIPRVEVDAFVSFYSFLSKEPVGRIVIRLCDDVVDRMHGFDRVAATFQEELGIGFGETTPDGMFTLEKASCIGMSDQAPAALVGDVVVTELSSDKASDLIADLREHQDPQRLVRTLGDGNNAHELVQAMVHNNVREAGPIVLGPLRRGEAIRKALTMSPVEVIRAIKTARLRGRGGAGFPTGMKWEYARNAEVESVESRKSDTMQGSRDYTQEFMRAAGGERKYVICNADEGEPGTFKDRVILTERADRVFAGMTVAAYAIGSEHGILYLRSEYAYLSRFLEHLLEKRREENLLGRNILGEEFHFDIRIQLGAGAYVCGEETGLINSCEGRRGDPRNRPPFPAQMGYLGFPTIVNNPETLCCVTKILEEGPATFCEYGSPSSTGTKLLSVAGDCSRPGVYEVPLSLTLRTILDLAGAKDAVAAQIGGPSGQMVCADEFDREVHFEDMPTGGSIMVFSAERNIVEIVQAFMEFFVHESCGYCTPCRVGNVILKEGIDNILDGRGEPSDLERLEALGTMIRATSRCGLGQTSPNPVLTTLRSFRPEYEKLVKKDADGFRRSFDLSSAVLDTRAITNGTPAPPAVQHEGVHH